MRHNEFSVSLCTDGCLDMSVFGEEYFTVGSGV